MIMIYFNRLASIMRRSSTVCLCVGVINLCNQSTVGSIRLSQRSHFAGFGEFARNDKLLTVISTMSYVLKLLLESGSKMYEGESL